LCALVDLVGGFVAAFSDRSNLFFPILLLGVGVGQAFLVWHVELRRPAA